MELNGTDGPAGGQRKWRRDDSRRWRRKVIAAGHLDAERAKERRGSEVETHECDMTRMETARDSSVARSGTEAVAGFGKKGTMVVR